MRCSIEMPPQSEKGLNLNSPERALPLRAAQMESLRNVLREVPDPRARNRKFPCSSLLMLVAMGFTGWQKYPRIHPTLRPVSHPKTTLRTMAVAMKLPPPFTCESDELPEHGRKERRIYKVYAIEPLRVGLPHIRTLVVREKVVRKTAKKRFKVSAGKTTAAKTVPDAAAAAVEEEEDDPVSCFLGSKLPGPAAVFAQLSRGNGKDLTGWRAYKTPEGSHAVKTAVAASKFKKFPNYGQKIKGHIMLTDHEDEAWFHNIKIRRILDIREEAHNVAGDPKDAATIAMMKKLLKKRQPQAKHPQPSKP